MEYQILLVEDDDQIREMIMDYFLAQEEKYINVNVAKDGEEGLFMIETQIFDLVILDIMLPDLDGFTLCRRLRERSSCPIVFLTARGREEDVLYGYSIGCDDYIVKPFSLATLYAKVNALLKRASGLVGAEVLRCGDVTLNPATLVVEVKGEKVNLPPKEYALLKCLMECKGRVVERDFLLARIWGYDYDGVVRVVDNHIKKLRKALGDEGKHIRTVITKGYKLE